MGAIIRGRRQDSAVATFLAEASGASRKFLIDAEVGHERAELGKTLAILTDSACPWKPRTPSARGSDHEPAPRDYAQTFTGLLAKRDFEFATQMLPDCATASL